MLFHGFRSYLLFCSLLLGCIFANPARSGTNEGFKASVEPRAVRNPEIGQIITIPVRIEGAKEAKGGLVTVHFDPAVFSFEAFKAGPFIPGMISLPAPVTEGEDGFSKVDGGGTQLGGVPASGSGVFGSMAFKVISEIPPSGSFISFTKIQIQAGSTDKDSLITLPRQFGVGHTLLPQRHF